MIRSIVELLIGIIESETESGQKLNSVIEPIAPLRVLSVNIHTHHSQYMRDLTRLDTRSNRDNTRLGSG